MNKEKAISNFLTRSHQFGQLLFVTDEELGRLFGEELTATVTRLEQYDNQESECLKCRGSCCLDIGCELYLPQFGRCPIRDFRPIPCRLHFCHHFDPMDRSLVLELRDVFLGIFTFAESHNSAIFGLLDTPPLARSSAEFVTAVSPSVMAIENGSLDLERGEELLRQAVADYRESHSDNARRD